jgi:hypothetical protein
VTIKSVYPLALDSKPKAAHLDVFLKCSSNFMSVLLCFQYKNKSEFFKVIKLVKLSLGVGLTAKDSFEAMKDIRSNLSDASSAVSNLSTAKDYPNALSHTALLIGNPFFASSHIRCAQLVEKVLKVKPESLSDSAALLISSHIRLPECSKDLFSHLVSVLALHCEASPKRTSLLAQMSTSGRDLLTFLKGWRDIRGSSNLSNFKKIINTLENT